MPLSTGILVAGSILGSATYDHKPLKRFGHEIISMGILSLPPIQMGQWSVTGKKYGHFILVNRSGSLPRNSADRLTGLLDMTLIALIGL